jgi:hypothetical protein
MHLHHHHHHQVSKSVPVEFGFGHLLFFSHFLKETAVTSQKKRQRAPTNDEHNTTHIMVEDEILLKVWHARVD